MRKCITFLAPLMGIVPVSMVVAATPPTTVYDADSNVLPNAPGQIFEGGTLAGGGLMSLVDLGGGDLVLDIDTQDTDASAYLEKAAGGTPDTWNVDRAVGFSVELRVRLDGNEATDSGGLDMIFASPDRFTSLRLVRGAGSPTMDAIFKSGLNNDILGSTSIANADEFHTLRVDVLGDNIDFWVDDVLALDNVQDPAVAPPYHLLRLGDGTGAGDGHSQIQWLKTWQDGVVPEPAAIALAMSGAGLLLAGRRRRM